MSELKPRITENGIDYILVGDYYIPDLKLPEEHRPIGKYGRMHREYLREAHPARLNTLTLTGELWTYLADLNEQAQERLDTIMEQMKAADGVTEELKRTHQMEWVQRCNNMEIYRSGRFKLAFSPAMQRYLKEHQRDFMPEDTKAGMIQAYLDKYTGSMVCSKQLYKEALNHAFDEPKQWEIREINEIMNQSITGWRYFPNPRMFSEYGRQKGWERENPATDSGNPSEKTMDGFVEVTEQMELPF